MALEAIDYLANLVHTRWSAENFNDRCFATLAAEALDETALHANLSSADIVDSMISPWRSTDNLSTHVSPGIVTLSSSTHFDIRGHLWVDAIGSPHQHGWTGAYQVIEGSSLQARFDFSQRVRVRPGFRLGELRMRSLEVLHPGHTVAVEPGRQMIHALWHVDRPAVSVSVRSKQYSDRTMDFLRPGVAFDTLAEDVDSEMRNRCLAFLARTDERAHQAQLERLARHADLPTTFFALRQALMEFDGVSDDVLAAARARHGDLFRFVESSLPDISRFRSFDHLRPQVKDPDSRLFLGLLYLAPDRETIRRFLAGQCPNKPIRDILGARLSNLVIRRPDLAESLPRGLGRAFGLIGLGAGLDRALEDLEATSAAEELPRLAALVESAHGEMQRSPVFGPLFA